MAHMEFHKKSWGSSPEDEKIQIIRSASAFRGLHVLKTADMGVSPNKGTPM